MAAFLPRRASARSAAPLFISALLAALSLVAAPVDPAIGAEAPGPDTNCVRVCPTKSSGGLRIVRRESHTLANNAETKFADWVAYEVDPADIGKSHRRVWRPDPEIPPEETLEAEDYKGAHASLKTDRGHQAPLASFSAMPDWKVTNYLSNITPQKSALNQGPWMRLESAVRKLAKAGVGPVHVITGPLYEREMPPLPGADEPHKVPSGYWKIIILSAPDREAAAGFVFDQDTGRRANYCAQAFEASLGDIAARSGLTFDPGILADAEGGLRRRLGCPVRKRAPVPSG